MHIVGNVTVSLPFQVQDVQRPQPFVELSDESKAANEEGMKDVDPSGALSSAVKEAFASHDRKPRPKSTIVTLKTDDLSPTASPVLSPVDNARSPDRVIFYLSS